LAFLAWGAALAPLGEPARPKSRAQSRIPRLLDGAHWGWLGWLQQLLLTPPPCSQSGPWRAGLSLAASTVRWRYCCYVTNKARQRCGPTHYYFGSVEGADVITRLRLASSIAATRVWLCSRAHVLTSEWTYSNASKYMQLYKYTAPVCHCGRPHRCALELRLL
jgi:hypothetical protein